MSRRSEGDQGETDTASAYVRDAIDGDPEARQWIIERFTPALLAQARFRLLAFPRLKGLYAPEDLVGDVWVRTLPKIPELSPRQASHTRTLLSFLSTCLLYRLNDLVDKHYGAKPAVAPLPSPSSTDRERRLADEVSGVVTRATRNERASLVLEALDELESKDRDVIVLKGIEGLANPEVGLLLDMTPKNVSVRYLRAIRRLRERLPGSLFDELPAD